MYQIVVKINSHLLTNQAVKLLIYKQFTAHSFKNFAVNLSTSSVVGIYIVHTTLLILSWLLFDQ